MSEQQQRPPVWLIWDSELDCWVDNVFRDRQGAEFVSDGDDVVEMVPREPDSRAELIAALREARAKLATVTILHMGEGQVPMWPRTLEQIDAALRKAGET